MVDPKDLPKKRKHTSREQILEKRELAKSEVNSALLDQFTTLSVSDRDGVMKIFANTTVTSQYRILKTLESLPKSSKSAVILKLIDRMIIDPGVPFKATLQDEVVLDSVLDTEKMTFEVNFPIDIEAYADSKFWTSIWRVLTSLPDVKIRLVNGGYDISDSSYFGSFVDGLTEEVLLESEIGNLDFQTTDGKSGGKVWIKYLLITRLLNDASIPDRYRKNIPVRIMNELTISGRIKAWSRSSLLDRAIASSKIADPNLRRVASQFLQNLTSFVFMKLWDFLKPRVKIGNFIAGENEIFSQRKESRIINGARVPVEITKPSELVTVFPFERKAVAEIFNSSWDKTKVLMKELKETIDNSGINTVWKSLEDKVDALHKEQKDARNEAEKLTSERFDLISKEDVPRGQNMLNVVRASLAEINSYSKALERNFDTKLIDPIKIWGRTPVKVGLGATKLIMNMDSKELAENCPLFSNLVEEWKAIYAQLPAGYTPAKLKPRIPERRVLKERAPLPKR